MEMLIVSQNYEIIFSTEMQTFLHTFFWRRLYEKRYVYQKETSQQYVSLAHRTVFDKSVCSQKRNEMVQDPKFKFKISLNGKRSVT